MCKNEQEADVIREMVLMCLRQEIQTFLYL